MLYNTAIKAYIPLPVGGPTAFALDGSAIFPPYNNAGGYTWESCEMDKCNAHVGQVRIPVGEGNRIHNPLKSTVYTTQCTLVKLYCYTINDYLPGQMCIMLYYTASLERFWCTQRFLHTHLYTFCDVRSRLGGAI